MTRSLVLACLVGILAGCEQKAPTQAGPKAVLMETTRGPGTTTGGKK